jgi:hypothetical protein
MTSMNPAKQQWGTFFETVRGLCVSPTYSGRDAMPGAKKRLPVALNDAPLRSR